MEVGHPRAVWLLLLSKSLIAHQVQLGRILWWSQEMQHHLKSKKQKLCVRHDRTAPCVTYLFHKSLEEWFSRNTCMRHTLSISLLTR